MQQVLRDTVEELLRRPHDPDTHERLDHLLMAQPPALLAEALHSWATGAEGKNTWLTNAVHMQNFEVVAILLYHGADAHQPCPLRYNSTAFDDVFMHYHGARRPQYYLMATLLNNKDVPPERVGHYTDEHLAGGDPDTLLLEVSEEGEESEGPDTALTLAVRKCLFYTIRYLIERRGSDMHVRDARDDMPPIKIAVALHASDAKEVYLKQRVIQYLQQRAEREVAFMMAHQQRLGRDSSLRHLFPETLQHIAQLASRI